MWNAKLAETAISIFTLFLDSKLRHQLLSMKAMCSNIFFCSFSQEAVFN